MQNVLFSIFLILHGLVHLWYFTLAAKLVEFKAEMGWDISASMISRILSQSSASNIAMISYPIIAFTFVVVGVLWNFNEDLSKNLLVVISIVSSIFIILFWDGSFDKVVENGLVGLIANFIVLYFFLR